MGTFLFPMSIPFQRPRFCHLGNVRRPPQTQLARSRNPCVVFCNTVPAGPSTRLFPLPATCVTVICQGTPLSSPLQKSAFLLNSFRAQAQITIIPVGPGRLSTFQALAPTLVLGLTCPGQQVRLITCELLSPGQVHTSEGAVDTAHRSSTR